MCVIAGWAALVLPARWAIWLGSALAAVFVVMLMVVSREPGWITWTFGVTLTTGAFVFVRRQRELVRRHHFRNAVDAAEGFDLTAKRDVRHPGHRGERDKRERERSRRE